MGQTGDIRNGKGTSEMGTYSRHLDYTSLLPDTMKGPNGNCDFRVTCPEISGTAP
jgi:hypothetical protein